MIKLVSRLLAAALSLCLVAPALAQVQPGQSPLTISKGGTGASSASGARTNLGLAIGSNVQEWDADLDALAALSGTNTIYYRSAINTWTGVTIGALLQFSGGTLNVGDPELVALAGLTSANNKCIYWTGSGTAATYDCSPYGRGLINAADASAARTTLALVIGTDVQAWDAELAAIAGLATAANKCTYWSGTATAALYDCTSYGRSLANAADASALRTLGGMVIGADVQGYDSDLGALAANSTNGLWARTGAGTGAARSLTAPAAGITVSNGDGVSGNPTLALANDLSAVEGLSGTGIARRTGTDTWSVGTAVANSELATMATGTFKGNVSGSTADPSDLTATQVTAALNAMVGDSGSGGTKGLVPAPGAGDAAAGKYLKADGTWAVPAGGGGGGGMNDTERQNAALTLIYQSKLFGGYRRLVNLFADGYKASDGINGGSSSNYDLDTTNGRVSPTVAPATSYANSGGTGNRTGIITASTSMTLYGGSVISNLVNGSFTADASNAIAFTTTGAVSGEYIRFDFGSGKVIDEAKWYQDASNTHGIWKWQGSNDASSWTDIGTTFTLGGTTQTITELSGNITAYRYYQLLGVSGNRSSTPWITEIEFKIGTGSGSADNMTLVTASQTTDTSRSNGRVLIEYDDACGSCDAVTLNTHLTAEVTCNGGTNWASATLSSVTAYSGGASQRKVAETADTAVTSGSSCAARIKTLSNKFIYVYGVTNTVH